MINGKIDLRSDTVTIPTDAMRKAMAEAPVGDDVYGDDITVNKLEAMAAELFGKEKALFVPSGTMGNQLALFTHVQRGEEVLLPDNCHIVMGEAGGAAVIAGAQLRCIQTVNKGEMPLDILEKSIRKDPTDIHQPSTALITYENADSDGHVRNLAYMADVKKLAEKYGLGVHVDGARFFNAATYLNTTVSEMAKYVDSVSVCLSKGLCAPVGSLLIGSADFIEKARRKRKLLGGGMRQVGILAAAGILSLTEMSKRLQEDHDNAKYMAQKLSELDNIDIDIDDVEISMIFFRLKTPHKKGDEFVKFLAKRNIIINGEEEGRFRFITHNNLSREEIDTVIEAIKEF